MDAARALDQIAEIHRQMAKGEVYRGYRSLPVAVSGAIGLVAAWFQPLGLAARDSIGFVVYWTAVAAAAALVGSSEILFNYAMKEDASGRRRTRRVAGQFAPALAGAVAITIGLVRFDPALVVLLPGVWAIAFGVAVFACRPYLPRASGWVALVYFGAGVALLWGGHGADPIGGWAVGGTFGIGQLLAAAVLWWNLERT
jgi:hypothetical protein